MAGPGTEVEALLRSFAGDAKFALPGLHCIPAPNLRRGAYRSRL